MIIKLNNKAEVKVKRILIQVFLSIICMVVLTSATTRITDTSVTGSLWLNATNVNATNIYADWYCLTPSCNHNITFNGTDSIIQ